MIFLIYKDYGKTGKKVSAVGFGGMRFVKEDDKYNYDKCIEVVRKASELGVNYFDTAPGYNDDESEKIFGEAFKAMPNEFYVSTKSSIKDGSKLREQLEKSLGRLGVEKINFFHIWCILSADDYKSRFGKGGAYEAAMKAKEEGLIEHVVFSTHANGDEIEAMVKENLFEGITVGYNILNFPYRQKGIDASKKAGLGIAVMNPLGGGIIPKKADYFDFLRDTEDKNVQAAAMRFLISKPEISIALAGMGTLEEVIENVSFAENTNPFTDTKMEQIRSQLFDSMDKLCTGCRYCEFCPKEIPVSKYLQAYNSKILGKSEDCLNQLKWHFNIPKEGVDACIECGICEKKCTQHIDIIKRLKEISTF